MEAGRKESEVSLSYRSGEACLELVPWKACMHVVSMPQQVSLAWNHAAGIQEDTETNNIRK